MYDVLLNTVIPCLHSVIAWTSLKSMNKTRWWAFFTLLESFMLNTKTLRYQRDSPHTDLVAPEVYNLSDLDWADIKVLCDIVMVFKLAQETLEGELYITGSRVVAILEKIRAGGLDPARTQVSPGVFGAFLHCDNCDKKRHRHLVPVFLYLTHRDMFLHTKKTGWKSGSYL